MQITASSRGALTIGNNVKYLVNAIQQALAEVVENAARPIEDEAKTLVPVDTGRLQRSIDTEMTETTPTRAVATVGPHTEYAGFVEFGTVHQRAQPYMRPAFDSKKQEAVDVLRQELRNTITEALVNATNESARRRAA